MSVGNIEHILGGEISDEGSLYALLGIASSAPDGEVRKAYYRAARKAMARGDEDELLRLHEAGRTLGDTRRRQEYDQVRRAGKRVEALVGQAGVAMKGDLQKSIALLRSAIALAPELSGARAMLAQILMRVKDYGAAEEQFRWLLRFSPPSEMLHFRLGRCLWLQRKPEEANRELRRALQINARFYDAWILRAQVCESLGEWQEATDALEAAIANDNREDLADFDPMVRLLLLCTRLGDAQKTARIAGRLTAILPPMGEGLALMRAQRAAHRVTERARSLRRKTGGGAAHRHEEAAAFELLQIVRRRYPQLDDPLLSQEIADMEANIALAQEAALLCRDGLISSSLRAYFSARYVTRSASAQQLRELLGTLQSELFRDPKAVETSLLYMRGEYPRVWGEESAFLSEISVRVKKALVTPPPPPTPQAVAPAPAPRPQEAQAEKPKKRGLLSWFGGR